MIYSCRILRQTTSLEAWYALVDNRLAELKAQYVELSHGLDLSKSGFLRSEVYKADECIWIRNQHKTCGYVFFFTEKRPSTLYVTLMVSFERGMGSLMMQILSTSLVYSHKYLALRATLQSVGFYVKLGFQVFDFITMEDYVNGSTNEQITMQILEADSDTTVLTRLQQQIVHMDWIHEDSDEFPLLKRRDCSIIGMRDIGVRKSLRLLQQS